MKSTVIRNVIFLLLVGAIGTSAYGRGKCTLGDCKEGYGEFLWDDGSFYKGHWHGGKTNGTGTYKSFYGILYRGQWKDNFVHGKGTMIYENGNKYVGYFVKGKRHGYGVLYDPRGNIINKGEWRNDKFVGK